MRILSLFIIGFFTIISFAQENNVAPEKNATIDKFNAIGLKSKTAFETQSLLQLKNEYCNKSKCLDCAIGSELLKN